MKILALDIGTNLGWARFADGYGTMGVGEMTTAGTLVLGTKKSQHDSKKQRWDRRLDIRARALALWLEAHAPIDWCVFEDVRFASSQAQAHLWGSFRGVIWSWAARRGVNIDCLDTGKLKLWATGHGGATKEMMAAAALRRWPTLAGTGPLELDDNGIDALCLLQWAREKIKV